MNLICAASAIGGMIATVIVSGVMLATVIASSDPTEVIVIVGRVTVGI
ncbi:MAG: hypothetical protein WBX25_36465 [Rhodomicrobium sp.]